MASKSKTEDQDAMLQFEFNGETLVMRQSEITGIDSRDFRAELGFGIAGIFNDPTRFTDVDSVAGIIWIIKRRKNPRLKFEEIAEKVTLADVFNVGEANGGDDEGAEDDPFGSEEA